MKISPTFCMLLLAALCLGGCGPREVNEGIAEDYSYNPGREPEDALRYPIDSSNRLQQRLYLLNQPERMVTNQQRQREMLLRYRGYKVGAPDPEEMPRQRSPFRE